MRCDTMWRDTVSSGRQLWPTYDMCEDNMMCCQSEALDFFFKSVFFGLETNNNYCWRLPPVWFLGMLIFVRLRIWRLHEADSKCNADLQGFSFPPFAHPCYSTAASDSDGIHFTNAAGSRRPSIEHSPLFGLLAHPHNENTTQARLRRADAHWIAQRALRNLMYRFYYHFNNLHFNKTQHINDLTAANVVVSFVSSELLKCRLSTWLLDHPMNIHSSPARGHRPLKPNSTK